MTRTVRGPKLAANQEIYQNIYGSAVEIAAVDDIINGDFIDVLQGKKTDLSHFPAAGSNASEVWTL